MGITRSVSVEKWANVNDTQSQSAIGVSVIQDYGPCWCPYGRRVVRNSRVCFSGPPQSDFFPFVTSRRPMSQRQFGWCN